jgi:hypothetical protein
MQNSKKTLLRNLIRQNVEAVKKLYPNVTELQLSVVRALGGQFHLSVLNGDLMMLDGKWYITHSGLLGIAQRRHCWGITAELADAVSDPAHGRWVFRATVRKSEGKNFVAYGDADASNVSPSVHGAELRVAETRAVNRALRAAYGIGFCSVEELASSAGSMGSARESKKFPPQPANGNYGAPKVRDRLCQIIRQHQLDPTLVKAYATDFCGAKTLREATRAQVENFVTHLADWAEKDRSALLCQLNSYGSAKEGAA